MIEFIYIERKFDKGEHGVQKRLKIVDRKINQLNKIDEERKHN